jgi:hypothetical protein
MLEIRQEDITFRRLTIPEEHGIDRLAELGTARLVDTACIDPGILQSITERLFTYVLYLGPATFESSISPILEFLEINLVITPGMR